MILKFRQRETCANKAPRTIACLGYYLCDHSSGICQSFPDRLLRFQEFCSLFLGYLLNKWH